MSVERRVVNLLFINTPKSLSIWIEWEVFLALSLFLILCCSASPSLYVYNAKNNQKSTFLPTGQNRAAKTGELKTS